MNSFETYEFCFLVDDLLIILYSILFWSVLSQQDACSDMLLRFDDVDSQLKNTMNENKRLRISLDAVKEKLARQENLTGERI